MPNQPFSTINLGLNLGVTDLLQVPPPASQLVVRALSNLAYQANLTVQYESYLSLNDSNSPFPLFGQGNVPVVYVRNASISGNLIVIPFFNGIAGAIGASTLDTPSSPQSPYVIGDTGIILGPSNNAAYVVNSIDGSGNVLTYTLTNEGTGYMVQNDVSTARAGAQPGTGEGFRINITAVSSAIQTKFVMGPGGVFLYYQLALNAALTNSMSALSLASESGTVLAEYLYAE
jgi:hypothetical protein